MKNIFKSLMIVVLFVGLGSNAFAQTQNAETASLTASATVLDALSITKTADMNFGNIPTTTDGAVKIDPKGSAHTYVGADVAVGSFKILGQAGASVQVSWTDEVDLTGPVAEEGPNPELNLNLEIYGHITTQGSATELITPGGSDITLAGSGDAVPGQYLLWVGGSLGTLASQTTGTYTGTVTVTADYN